MNIHELQQRPLSISNAISIAQFDSCLDSCTVRRTDCIGIAVLDHPYRFQFLAVLVPLQDSKLLIETIIESCSVEQVTLK
jgi:hypothetical protein